uniref:Uncharacterized protein n=1 Tax=Cacopsylla melanoneura TaxID=428564 RepID=A0A8D8Z030_9HEMI
MLSWHTTQHSGFYCSTKHNVHYTVLAKNQTHFRGLQACPSTIKQNIIKLLLKAYPSTIKETKEGIIIKILEACFSAKVKQRRSLIVLGWVTILVQVSPMLQVYPGVSSILMQPHVFGSFLTKDNNSCL